MGTKTQKSEDLSVVLTDKVHLFSRLDCQSGPLMSLNILESYKNPGMISHNGMMNRGRKKRKERMKDVNYSLN